MKEEIKKELKWWLKKISGFLSILFIIWFLLFLEGAIHIKSEIVIWFLFIIVVAFTIYFFVGSIYFIIKVIIESFKN